MYASWPTPAVQNQQQGLKVAQHIDWREEIALRSISVAVSNNHSSTDSSLSLPKQYADSKGMKHSKAPHM